MGVLSQPYCITSSLSRGLIINIWKDPYLKVEWIETSLILNIAPWIAMPAGPWLCSRLKYLCNYSIYWEDEPMWFGWFTDFFNCAIKGSKSSLILLNMNRIDTTTEMYGFWKITWFFPPVPTWVWPLWICMNCLDYWNHCYGGHEYTYIYTT